MTSKVPSAAAVTVHIKSPLKWKVILLIETSASLLEIVLASGVQCPALAVR